MTMAPSTAASAADGLLASLDPEQRAAATLPDGPAIVIAPAGSGKTTTLIARLGVLLGRGVPADRIGVVTFNRDAAAELSARIASRLAPHVPGAEAIEVRTLHAMARQVLLDGGRPVRLANGRLPLLRAARRRALAELPAVAEGDDPPPEPPDPSALDTIVSAWKVEGRPPPSDAASAIAAFEALLAARGLIDFDDLVVGAVTRLERDDRLRTSWQSRFTHLCVDEFQDVDAAQLRLVWLLAAPQDNLFVVGDDDQTLFRTRTNSCLRASGTPSDEIGGRRRVAAPPVRRPRESAPQSRRSSAPRRPSGNLVRRAARGRSRRARGAASGRPRGRLHLLRPCWAHFDDVAARVAAELRPGSRGGGRSREQIIRHVYGTQPEPLPQGRSPDPGRRRAHPGGPRDASARLSRCHSAVTTPRASRPGPGRSSPSSGAPLTTSWITRGNWRIGTSHPQEPAEVTLGRVAVPTLSDRVLHRQYAISPRRRCPSSTAWP